MQASIAIFLAAVSTLVCFSAFTGVSSAPVADLAGLDIADPAKVVGQHGMDNLRTIVALTLSKGGKEGLNELANRLAQEVMRRRLEKCMQQFGSYAICDGRVNFYIWAQTLAKDIMAGHDLS